MNTEAVALIAVFTPLGLAGIAVLWRAGTVVGRVGEQLGDHERRLGDLEDDRRQYPPRAARTR